MPCSHPAGSRVESTGRWPPAAILFDDGHEEWVVEDIVGKRGKGGKVQYLVKWLGYPISDAEWHGPADLAYAWDTIVEYDGRQAEGKPVGKKKKGVVFED
jgi:hypothetical protein